MAKESKDGAFDALAEIEAARASAKSCAVKAVRKAKAGGGIAAALRWWPRTSRRLSGKAEKSEASAPTWPSAA